MIQDLAWERPAAIALATLAPVPVSSEGLQDPVAWLELDS